MASGRIVLPNAVPVGYRFQPTDEEIVGHFLKNKMLGYDRLVQPIPEVDVCKYEPWELPNFSMVESEDQEWFFFSIRDFKYCHGRRSNRATREGYWKATGNDRKIKARRTKSLIGTKKTLVFYKGRVPNGIRTNWVMHEYHSVDTYNQKKVYVVCRLKKKYDEKCKNDDVDPNLETRTIESAVPEESHEENGGLLFTLPLPDATTEDEIDVDEFVDSLIVDGNEYYGQETIDPFDHRFVESQWSGSSHLDGVMFEDLPPNLSTITECSSWNFQPKMRMMRNLRSRPLSNHIFDTNIPLGRSFLKTEHEESDTSPAPDGKAVLRIRLQRMIRNAAMDQNKAEEASKYLSNDGREKNETRTRPPSEYFANIIVGIILFVVFVREMVLYGEWGCKFRS